MKIYSLLPDSRNLSICAVLALSVVPALQASRLTPVERATHIVHGIIESSDCQFAGGVIAVTETKLKVWEVLKNSDNALKAGDMIKILTYGCFEGEILHSNSESETILFDDGAEVVLPLAKYYDHYKLFEESEPFAIGHVHKNQVLNYDPEAIGNLGVPNAKARFIARLNLKRRMGEGEASEKLANAINEDLFLRQRAANFGQGKEKPLNTYLSLLQEKSALAGMNGARKAPLVVKVKIASISVSGGKDDGVSEIRFTWLQDIKGKINAKEFTLVMPGPVTAKACGFLLPQPGQTGLLLMKSKDKVLPIPEYFIPLDEEESIKIGAGRMKSNEWKRNMSAER